MKKLFYLFFTTVVMLILPACNGDPDFLKDMPPASGDGNTDDDENSGDEESGEDPNFQIYLCFGESNMEGTAAIADTDLEGIGEHFKVMAVVSDGWDRVAGSWYTAVPPLCRPSTGLSPIDYFGRKMLEGLSENNPDVTIGVIMVAVSDAGIKAFHKTEYKSYYEAASENVKNLMNCYDGYPYGKLVDMAREAQKQGTIKGILMHHGETDANEDYWEGTVKDIYDNLISDLSLKAENTPLLVGEMCKDKDFVANNDKIDNLTSSIENCYIISSEGCTGNDNADDHKHFSAEGYRTLGEHYAETMLKILAGQQDEDPNNWFEFKEGQFKQIIGNEAVSYDWSTGEVTNGGGINGWTFDTGINLKQSGKKYLVAKFREAGVEIPKLEISNYTSIWDGPTYQSTYTGNVKDGIYSVIDLSQELKSESGETIDIEQIKMVALRCNVEDASYVFEKVYFSDINPLDEGGTEEPDDDYDNWFEFKEGLFKQVIGNESVSYNWSTGEVTNGGGINGWTFDSGINLKQSGKKYLVAKFKEVGVEIPKLEISNHISIWEGPTYQSTYTGNVKDGIYSVIDLSQELKSESGETIYIEQIKMVALRCNVEDASYVFEKVYFSDINPLDEGGTEEPDEPENDPTKWFEFISGRVATIYGSPSMDWSSKKVSYNGKDDIIIGWKFNGSDGNPSPINLENGGYLIAKVSNIQGASPQFYISNNPNLSFSLYIESENCKEIDGIWYSVIDLSKAEYKDLNGENVLLNNIQLVGFRTEKGEEGNSSFVVEEIILSDTNPLENQSSDE